MRGATPARSCLDALSAIHRGWHRAGRTCTSALPVWQLRAQILAIHPGRQLLARVEPRVTGAGVKLRAFAVRQVHLDARAGPARRLRVP